jgi:hypothetical protein
MVGYYDIRYHIETVMVVFMLLLCATYCVNVEKERWHRISVIILLIVLVTQLPLKVYRLLPRLHHPFVNNEIIFPKVDEEEWIALLQQDSGKHKNIDIKVFFLESSLNCFRIGALLDLRCYGFLNTPTSERLLYLTTEIIKPDYIITDNDSNQWLSILKTIYNFIQISDNTYRVILKANE